MYSIPIRMPGQALQVQCNKPKFQITLRGGGDDQGVFENNQQPNKWQSQTLHYALGRVAYDLVFPDSVHDEEKEVQVSIHYSVLIPEEKTNNIKLALKQWNFNFVPNRWFKLPKSETHVKKIKVTNPPGGEFRLAVAGLPLRILTQKSTGGVLDLSTLDSEEVKGVLVNGALDFEQVFGAWLVFDDDLETASPVPALTLQNL
jgi:hypothetical protein